MQARSRKRDASLNMLDNIKNDSKLNSSRLHELCSICFITFLINLLNKVNTSMSEILKYIFIKDEGS